MPNVKDLKKQFELQKMRQEANEGRRGNGQWTRTKDKSPPAIMPNVTVTPPSDNHLKIPSPKMADANLISLQSIQRDDGDAESEMIDSDLSKLKAMTERLKLSTQRPSYVEWKNKYMGKPDLVKSLSRGSLAPSSTIERKKLPWTIEREAEIKEAMEWLKNELLEMRNSDQQLARTLVTLRHNIHELKLELSINAHRMVIEDVEYDLEEEDALSELSDCPLGIGPLSPLAPLKQFGVTKMNIERRRFSLC